MTSSTNRTFNSCAITTYSAPACEAGIHMLKKGGSAADAAIAVLLCEGVCSPQSMGVGGGFLLTMYSKDKKIVEVLNARECAPIRAKKDMYEKNKKDISEGGLAVAVPSEIKGYWELHQKYGKLKWKELFNPVVKLCRSGIPINKNTSNALYRMQRTILSHPTLREIFTDRKTGKLLKEGDYMMRPKLADTLTAVAMNGPDILYHGSLTSQFVRDIQSEGGIITEEDLANYKPRWQRPLTLDLPDNLIAYSPPPPGSGSILLTILDSLSRRMSHDRVLFYHRLVEIFKFAFGLKAKIGGPVMEKHNNIQIYDPTYVEEMLQKLDDSKTYPNTEYYCGTHFDMPDNGTCHICVLAPNGDAIAATSTINDGLGAAFVSPSTGIILNDEMMDFSIPKVFPWDLNPFNFIEPNKQPMSSMCPTIILNRESGQIRLVIGGAGGMRIITAVSQVVAKNLWINSSIYDAIAAPRLHHQLLPMRIEFEEPFESGILKELKKKGHVMRLIRTAVQNEGGVEVIPILPSVNAISIEGNRIHSVGDPRRFSASMGF